jgi:hypothetical protein
LHLKDQIKAETDHIMSIQSKEGWNFRSSKQQFSKVICPGLSLHCLPCWTFQAKGGIASSQPLLFVRSEIVYNKGLQVFDLKENNPGQFLWHYQHGDLRNAGQGARKFVEFEVDYFCQSNGYFPGQYISQYLTDLLEFSVDFLSNKFDTTSEWAFVSSLPEDFEYPSHYYGWGSNGFGVYLLTKLMLGDEVRYRLWRDHFSERMLGQEKHLLAKLDALSSQVLSSSFNS